MKPEISELLKRAPKQARVLNFITAYIDMHGVAPTQKEIAAAIDGEQSNVSDMLVKLERKGFIEREPMAFRSIKVRRYA